MTLLEQAFDETGQLLDKIIEVLQRIPQIEVVDLETLALAARLTPSDTLRMGDIQQALGLLDTNTVQDAINAASH